MSSDLLQALQRAHEDLQAELAAAESRLASAQQAVDAVRHRCQQFATQLNEVCAAAGIPISAVLHAESDPEEEVPMVASSTARTVGIDNPLALPSKPGSQRWFAGQALHLLGGEAPITEVAAEMRRLGYAHSRAPVSNNQLEASLAALPSQVSWIVAGHRPGHLRLHLSRQG